jgi:hypothetical protein
MAEASKSRPHFDTPLELERVDGEVVVTGPGGFCGSFTLEAARQSARRLLDLTGDDEGPTYQKPLG